MLEWLRHPPRESLTLPVGGRALPVAIRRLSHARRMTLRLAPDGSEIRLSIPAWCRTAEALAFAASRTDWLEAQFDRLPSPSRPGPGVRLPFRGEDLELLHDPAAPRRPRLAEGAIGIGGPAEGMENRLRRWLESEAKLLLAQDLAEYCARARRDTGVAT